MEAVIASIFRSWFDKLTTNGRYIEAFIFAVRLSLSCGGNPFRKKISQPHSMK